MGTKLYARRRHTCKSQTAISLFPKEGLHMRNATIRKTGRKEKRGKGVGAGNY